jgi:antitoxin component YwqK of YwqJK toxin-antitoxin module
LRGWDESGRLLEESNSKNGKIHGTVRRYFPSGGLYSESTWVDGNLNGPAREWTESKILKREESYKDGSLDGDVILFYEDGKKYQQETYQNGKLKQYTRHFPHGGVFEAGSVDADGITSCTFFYPNGDQAFKIRTYKNDSDEVRLFSPHSDSKFLYTSGYERTNIYGVRYPTGEVFHTARTTEGTALFIESQFDYQNGKNFIRETFEKGKLKTVTIWNLEGNVLYSLKRG